MNLLLLKSTHAPRRVLLRVLFFGFVLYAVYLLSHELSFFLESNTAFPYPAVHQLRVEARIFGLIVVPLQLIALYFSKFYSGIFAYFRMPDLRRTVFSMTLASLFLFILVRFGIPRLPIAEAFNLRHATVIILNYFFALGAVCGIRITARYLWEHKQRIPNGLRRTERVAIFGAGDAGMQTAEAMLSRPAMGKIPVIFFDDDPEKCNMSICGLSIVPTPANFGELRERYSITQVVIAIPTGTLKRVREITELAHAEKLKVLRVPSLEELASGRTAISDLREIALEDLLDRPPLDLDDDKITGMISGKVVLVTGAGGSIGSEICRQIAERAPAHLLLVEQCEVLLYSVEQSLIGNGHGTVIKSLIGDITDRGRMEQIFEIYHPEIVFHAAAHKHVPMMESQPAEAIKNNSLGSAQMMEIASRFQAETFVLISTDKAINPTNAMGASKRLAEITLQSIAQDPSNKTRFMAVRFGNVLGSSGSVIPLFKKQIAAGGPLTVTHQDIKRYFMTIPEAVGLVLQTATIGEGGSIYVLDMGTPVKIIDVARRLIELSGLRPNIDIDVKVVGLRPGEKLFEELKTTGEEFEPSGHPRISRFVSAPLDYSALDGLLKRLRKISENNSANEVKIAIAKIVPEYKPYLN